MPLRAWVQNLERRLEFIKTWVAKGVPNVFWISGFFFPQAFLTGTLTILVESNLLGTLQNYARKYTESIDTLSWGFEVIKEPEEKITSRPPDGCYIKGLFLEGARFDTENGQLAESHLKKLYEPLPIVCNNVGYF